MFRRYLMLAMTFLMCGATSSCSGEGPEILGVSYQADVPFPQFSQFWKDSSAEEEAATADVQKAREPLGGYVHVFLRNSGSEPIEIEDVLLEGVSLKKAVAYSDQRKFKKVARAANLYFSDLPQADRDRLISLGEPVWWKAEPATIPAQGVGEVVIRLRRTPKAEKVQIGVVAATGTLQASAPMHAQEPRVESIGFAPGLYQVYLYVRHPEKGRLPAKVLLDGEDITGRATVGKDSGLDTTPVVCRLSVALEPASFHVFQAVYDDGAKASAGIRAYADEMVYGLWGARPGKESEVEIGRAYVRELALHNVNVQMEMLASDAVRAFMNSAEGIQLMRSLGIRRIVGDPGKSRGLAAAYYLADEPDTADYRVEGVPWASKVGSLGQGLIARAEEVRAADPGAPTMVNVDMTFKPENWYTYGQLPDIFAADPYYQTRLCQAYWSKPETISKYAKCTFVHAVASICRSACAPKPLHLILNCTRTQKEGRRFRFGTPQEKRIEVYYALAAGAKAFSYWWFVPIGPNESGGCGCSVDEPEAKALWREIGLLGAEVRTVGPLLTVGCPANLQVTAPEKLWVRSVLSGMDTAVILCANDDYSNDDKGTNIRPVENAEVSVTLTAWLDAKDVFEVDYRGIHNVRYDRAESKLDLHLGTVNVTRMIVVTADEGLRERLSDRYREKFSANAAKLAGE
jgi:hypothetical protein